MYIIYTRMILCQMDPSIVIAGGEALLRAVVVERLVRGEFDCWMPGHKAIKYVLH